MMAPSLVLCGELWLHPEARPSILLSSFLSVCHWGTVAIACLLALGKTTQFLSATAQYFDIYRMKRWETIPVTAPIPGKIKQKRLKHHSFYSKSCQFPSHR